MKHNVQTTKHASNPCLTTQSQVLTTPRKKLFQNSVGKGENAGNQHFLLFRQCFLLYQNQFSSFEV